MIPADREASRDNKNATQNPHFNRSWDFVIKREEMRKTQ
jgi:hypothetical protein